MRFIKWGSRREPPQAVSIGTVADRLVAPVCVVASDGTLLYVNIAGARSIGQEPDWLIGRNMLELVHPDDRKRINRQLQKVALARPSGGFTRYRMRGDINKDWRVFDSVADNLIDDPSIAGILVTSRDVTEQIRNELKLYEAAYLDVLTGLPNRARINEELAALIRNDESFCVAIVGVDRFNLINDSLGHTAGDNVLRTVSSRIESIVSSQVHLGRLSGEYFVLLVREATATESRQLMWRILDRIEESAFILGRELQISASAGVTEREAGATAEALLREANLALHHAMLNGGGRVELFEPHMHDAAVARLELEANLRLALEHKELALALQPIFRLDTGEPVYAEALVRWHRDGKVIQPSEFIPVAEETGLVVPLGDWTLERAAQLVPYAPGGRISVNLSARQLGSPGLPGRIARVLKLYQLDPRNLGFEVTETLLVENFDYAANILHSIRKLGCRVGLDDFGVGFSSLSYLRKLPIDFLKIDRSLVADIDKDPQAAAIVKAIITMTDALGLDVIAEGVEWNEELEVLRDLGCNFVQGYLLGRPFEPQ